MNSIKRLQRLYGISSKHSNYQILPESLRELLDPDGFETCSRYEGERFRYIVDKQELSGKTILDIGSNSGYFAFESLQAGARHVTCYEGHAPHCEFVQCAGDMLGRGDDLDVVSAYYDFNRLPEVTYDVGFLLNVLHHVGDDFGDASISMSAARELIIDHLRQMAACCRTLVFQLGFCWQGDRNRLLFDHGTKQEMIDFIRAGTEGAWAIRDIGIAVMDSGAVSYCAPTADNLRRKDDMGEFLNRPIFIMDSLVG